MEGGERTRFQPKYPTPSPGDRFGELTVIRFDRHKETRGAIVACSCGHPEYFVSLSNLHMGKTTRCGTCGRKKARNTYVKRYFKYAEIVPDNEHRRRLINRLSAAIGRCHNSHDRGYRNYGGRGIEVCEETIDQYTCGTPTTCPGNETCEGHHSTCENTCANWDPNCEPTGIAVCPTVDTCVGQPGCPSSATSRTTWGSIKDMF